jgi:tetratricopeptide (TPR) repeat protein
MGKSVLIDHFAAELGPHWTILRSRCFEQESVPYKAFDGLVDAVSELLTQLSDGELAGVIPPDARTLAVLFPVLLRIPAIEAAPERSVDRSNVAEIRRRATAALRELLERLSDRRKMLLCIDDFQWADEDSRALLRELLQPPKPPSLVLVLACREEQQSHAVVDELRRMAGGGKELGIVDVELAPLSLDRAAELARARLAEGGEIPDEERVQLVARDCEGSPYLLAELVAGAALTGRANKSLNSLDSVLWSKVETLTPASRRILELLAVSVRPETNRNICTASGAVAIDPAIVAPLLSSRLIYGPSTDPAGQISIWHDRVRHTVLAHMDDGAKASAHLALARTLDAAGEEDPEILAVHWDAGGELAPALRCYQQAAARASAALAFEQTARYYRRAYAICLQTPNSPADEIRVLLAEALSNVGRPLESAELFAEAAAQSSGAALLDLRRRAAHQFCRGGYMQRGRQETLGVLRDAGIAVQRSERAALLSLVWSHLTLSMKGCRFRSRTAAEIEPRILRDIDITWSAALGLYMVDMVFGAELLARSLKLALRAGEPSRVVRALAWYAATLALGGVRFERQAWRMLDLAGELADRCGDPYSAGMVRLGRGSARFNFGYFADCADDLEQARSIFLESCAGARGEASLAATVLAWTLGTQGRHSLAWPLTERLYREACERGNRLDAANLALAPLYAGLLMRDRTDEALTIIREMRAEWSKHASTLQIVMADIAEAVVMLYRGSHQESSVLVVRARNQAQKAGLLRSQWLRGTFTRMEALHAMNAQFENRRGDHRGVILRSAKLLDAEHRDWGHGFAALLRAGLASVDGNQAACLKWLRVGEEYVSKAGLCTHRDLARYRLGQLIGGDQGSQFRREAEASLRHELAGNLDRLLQLFIPMRGD